MTDPNLADNIIEIVDRHHVPHRYIEIELTETTTDVEFTDLKRVVGGLREAGICTSIDDFGMGYSSPPNAILPSFAEQQTGKRMGA